MNIVFLIKEIRFACAEMRKKYRRPLYQILIAMKLTIFFVVLFSLRVSANVIAQGITLSYSNAPLKTVINAIAKQGKVDFFYDDEIIKNAKPVTLNVHDYRLEEALKVVFRNQPFSFEVEEGIVYLKPQAARRARIVQDTIRGTVTDSLGKPLAGVSVKIVGTSKGTTTNSQGRFQINNYPQNAELSFHLLGYDDVQIAASPYMLVNLSFAVGQLAEADLTINTGYQSIPRERATGSFVVLDSALIHRNVSTDFISRLNGNVTGLNYYNTEDYVGIVASNPITRNYGIYIRGISTVNGNTNPLIVLDNFPYEGELKNINPNDIETITILKDAAAASIWGARSGNGVVVITTKKGSKGSKDQISFSSNFTVERKRDIFYDPNYISSSDYIEIEQVLYDEGAFDTYLDNNISFPFVSPAVEIMANQGLSEAEKQQALDVLRQHDVRNDYLNHVYQPASKQQYYLGIRGASSRHTYALSIGYDYNKEQLIRNSYQRLNLNLNNSYSITPKLELNYGVIYNNSATEENNELIYGSGLSIGGSQYRGVYPYARFADDLGNHLNITKDYRDSYVSGMESAGFKNWQYNPLNEIDMGDNATKINNLLLRASLRYNIISGLNIEMLYQNERQKINRRKFQSADSYYTRDMINKFSVLNANGTITYQFPSNGGILNNEVYDWNANNIRTQLSYNKTINTAHEVSSIGGIELRELRTEGIVRTSYGYDEQFGTSTMNLDYSRYLSTNPSGIEMIPAPAGNTIGSLNRYFSAYVNGAYTYDKRYTITLSGRKDGANLFGVNTNQKITPLWSAGAAWKISNETFYSLNALESLNIRLSYGYNGNVYYGSAYTTGIYSTDFLTGQPNIIGLTAPNPDLRWERIKNVNLGVDFSLKGGILDGTIEYYRKDGSDLVQTIQLAHSSGFRSYTGNAAQLRTNGVDITINSRNLNKAVTWNSSFLFSFLKDKVMRYDVAPTSNSFYPGKPAYEGKALFGIYSYKWAGLDPENGDPQGYLNGQVSKDYNGIIGNYDPDSLIYHGSSMPQVFGSLRNDFSFRGFSLSFNILYKLDYVFRRPSISLNYTDLIAGYANSDYSKRWQSAGNESNTSVPSLVYNTDAARNNFYQYSEVLVEKGDHIRLQDVRLGYDLKRGLPHALPFRACNLYVYMSNLGIIWRANKSGIDPNVPANYLSHFLPQPFACSFGVNVTL